MTPLDLSIAPPRAPSETLGGVVMLARTTDKIRAMLPGGKLGEYTIPGFSQMLLDALAIDLAALTAAVAAAVSDDDVAAFVRAGTTPERIEQWNAMIRARKPRNGDREGAYEVYPWLRERPDLILALDVLAEDDRQLFATAT